MSNRSQILAERIKALGLRQNRLAKLSGLDVATVSTILSGRRTPLISTLEALEAAVASEEARLREVLASDAERKEVA